MEVEEKNGKVFVKWWSPDVVPPPAYAGRVAEGSRADIWTEVLWSAPAVMILCTGAVPTSSPRPLEDLDGAVHSMTPDTATTSHYFFCIAHKLDLPPEFTAFLKAAVEHAFVNEDKPMLEAQQARLGSRDFWSMGPALMSLDNPAVRARRRLKQLIDAED